MDIIVEFLLELLFEVPVDLAMGSKKLKTWVKTTLYCILGGIFAVALIVLSVLAWLNWSALAAAAVTVFSLIMITYFVRRAIRGHKENWKNW